MESKVKRPNTNNYKTLSKLKAVFKKSGKFLLKTSVFILKLSLPLLFVALLMAILNTWLKVRWTNATSLSFLLIGGTIVIKNLVMNFFEKFKEETTEFTKKSKIKIQKA